MSHLQTRNPYNNILFGLKPQKWTTVQTMNYRRTNLVPLQLWKLASLHINNLEMRQM